MNNMSNLKNIQSAVDELNSEIKQAKRELEVYDNDMSLLRKDLECIEVIKSVHKANITKYTNMMLTLEATIKCM